MSKFYGTLRGARGEATRQGHSSICASAQSWQGSIIVELFEQDGETVFEIRTGEGSTAYGSKTILGGKLAELLKVNTLHLDLTERTHEIVNLNSTAWDLVEQGLTPEQ